MMAVIVDPALRAMGGHHFNAVLELRRELDALGMEHRCLGSAFADDQTVSALGCLPTFGTSVYGRTYASASEFEEKVRETARDLSQGLRRLGVEPDLFILPCCDQVLALAMARQTTLWRRRASPGLLLWILLPPRHDRAFDEPDCARFREECRIGFQALQRSAKGRMKGYCETRPLADAYRVLTGLQLSVAAGPGLLQETLTRPRAASLGDITVAAAGFANRAKGYGLLPGAIASVLATKANVRFRIHGIVQGSDAEEQQPLFDALSALGPRVAVRTDVMPATDYAEWLRAADLVLLPYDPAVYRTRGSGLFVEARRLGIPVIVTQGCAFAEEAFAGGWGTPIARPDEASVAAAVLEAYRRFDEMKPQARAAAARAELTCHEILRDALADIPRRRRSLFHRAWATIFGRDRQTSPS